jgi:hypothetical protein
MHIQFHVRFLLQTRHRVPAHWYALRNVSTCIYTCFISLHYHIHRSAQSALNTYNSIYPIRVYHHYLECNMKWIREYITVTDEEQIRYYIAHCTCIILQTICFASRTMRIELVGYANGQFNHLNDSISYSHVFYISRLLQNTILLKNDIKTCFHKYTPIKI